MPAPYSNFTKIAGDTNGHCIIDTQTDNRQVRINSRDFVQTTGSSIGIQCKPRQNATSTCDVIGAEISPRTGDVGAGALIAVRGDPVLQQATAARTVSAVRGYECNIDFPGAGSAITITNDVTAFRTFLDMGVGHTVSGKKSVVLVATPNTSGWDYLFDLEASSGVVTSAAVGGSQDKKINIRIAGTNYFIPCHTT